MSMSSAKFQAIILHYLFCLTTPKKHRVHHSYVLSLSEHLWGFSVFAFQFAGLPAVEEPQPTPRDFEGSHH